MWYGVHTGTYNEPKLGKLLIWVAVIALLVLGGTFGAGVLVGKFAL